MPFLHAILTEFDLGVGYFNWFGPEISNFKSEIDLEVTFELHCRTANPKYPALYIFIL